MKKFIKEIIDFIKEDPVETVGGLLAWGGIFEIIFVISIIGG